MGLMTTVYVLIRKHYSGDKIIDVYDNKDAAERMKAILEPNATKHNVDYKIEPREVKKN
jgi:hypothetical protein